MPDDKIAARYPRSLKNLAAAVRFVPAVRIYDNSSAEDPFRLLAVFERGRLKAKTKGPVPAWAASIVS